MGARRIHTRIRVCITTAIAACSALSGAAIAHPGHADGALSGLLHPLVGLDHLLAMVAIGVWASQLGKTGRWLIPASFVAVMGLAAAAGMAGLTLPAIEMGIAGSLVLAGLLIALRVKVAPLAGALIVALFAVFHGFAHGAEIPAQAVPWQYFVGFLLATALLHGLGLALGPMLGRWKAALTTTGAALAVCGSWMLATYA